VRVIRRAASGRRGHPADVRRGARPRGVRMPRHIRVSQAGRGSSGAFGTSISAQRVIASPRCSEPFAPSGW
jgi:hypothetical protein